MVVEEQLTGTLQQEISSTPTSQTTMQLMVVQYSLVIRVMVETSLIPDSPKTLHPLRVEQLTGTLQAEA